MSLVTRPILTPLDVSIRAVRDAPWETNLRSTFRAWKDAANPVFTVHLPPSPPGRPLPPPPSSQQVQACQVPSHPNTPSHSPISGLDRVLRLRSGGDKETGSPREGSPATLHKGTSVPNTERLRQRGCAGVLRGARPQPLTKCPGALPGSPMRRPASSPPRPPEALSSIEAAIPAARGRALRGPRLPSPASWGAGRGRVQ